MAGATERDDGGAITRSALTVLAANAGLAVAAFSFAAITVATSLQAVGVQALLAACAQCFLLHGLRPASSGRDGEFWALVVPMLLYAFGAGIALLAGTQRLALPAPAEALHLADDLLAQSVLVFAVVLLAGALWSLVKGPAAAVRDAPASKLALTLEAAAGLAGVIAAATAFLLWVWGNNEADAYGAACVGLVMAAVAARLALEVRGRLRGRQEAPERAASMQTASPFALETKSVPLAADLGREPSAQNQAALPAAKPGQKPPVVARRSDKRGGKRR